MERNIITVIAGSARKSSNTGVVAEFVREYLMENDVDVLWYDLHCNDLPIFTGDEVQGQLGSVWRLREYARRANGFFICTPEYHNGMSGALKNALDFLDATYFQSKPIAIAAAAGGGKGGINALNNLRLVLRGVYGLVLPNQCVVDPNFIDGERNLTDVNMKIKLLSLADELVRETKLRAFVSVALRDSERRGVYPAEVLG